MKLRILAPVFLSLTGMALAQPTISTVQPSQITAGAATQGGVVIGSGFFACSFVTWQGSSLTSNSPNGNTVNFTVPASFLTTPGQATVTVTNPPGCPAPGTSSGFIINIVPPPTIANTSLPQSTVGHNFPTTTLTATNGTAPFQFFATNALPGPNLTLNTDTGQISGSYNGAPGTFPVTFQVVDTYGISGTRTLNFVFNAAPVITSPNLLPSAIAGAPYSYTIQTTGGTQPFTWSLLSSPPPFVVDPVTGVISGTDNVVEASSISVQLVDAANASTSKFFTINVLGPAISNLQPSTLAAGSPQFTMTVNGSNFAPGSVVRWNNAGTTNLATTYVNSSQLTATVPASLVATTGTAAVSVQNPGGTTSGTVQFTITPSAAITVTSVTPNTAPAASTPVAIVVSGTNFCTISGNTGAVATFNGTSLQSTVSGNTVNALIPANLLTNAGTGAIGVTNPAACANSGNSTNTVPFTVVAPTLTAVSLSQIIVGAPSFLEGAVGANFVPGSVLQWTRNGVITNLATTYLSPTQLSAQVPSSLLTTAGNATLSVVNLPGTAVSGTLPFVIVAPFTVTSVAPTSVPAGSAATPIVIAGTDLCVISGNSGTIGTFNGTPLPTTVNDDGTVSATIPANLLTTVGVAAIGLQNPAGCDFPGTAINTVPFGVNAPSITSISPNQATVGSPGFLLTVNGADFASGATINFNGTVLSTAFLSSTQLSATVTAAQVATIGTKNVFVQNPGPYNSANATFTVAPGGTISILDPSTIPAGSPAFVLTVDGTNLTSGSIVRWNTTSLATTYINATQLTAIVPSNLLITPGSVNIVVVDPVAGPSPAALFRVNPPLINFPIPTSATVNDPSAAITLDGANFVNGSMILWNGSNTGITTTFLDPNHVSTIVPGSLLTTLGTVNLTVENPGGSVSNAVPFNVVSGATITSLSPASAPAGSPSMILSVNGTGFSTGPVLWNGAPLPTTFVSSTLLRAQVSASLLTTAGPASVSVQDGNVGTLPATFTVNPPSLTMPNPPPSVTAGGPAFMLILIGANFVDGSQAFWSPSTTSSSNNAIPLVTTYLGPGILSVEIPAQLIQSSGIVSLTVRNPGGSTSNGITYSIRSLQITSISPSVVDAGGPAFNLTVTGGGFGTGYVVNLNGSALQTTFVSPTTLTAVVPAALIGVPGTALVTVSSSQATSNSLPLQITQPGLTIVTQNLPDGIAGSPYTAAVSAIGGFTPYTFSARFSTGNFTINSATGIITGRVTQPTSVAVSVTVTDQSGGFASRSYRFDMLPPALTIVTQALTPGSVGKLYQQSIQVVGGIQPYAFNIATGPLPGGITLNPQTGVLSGTPSATGTFSVTLQVTDQNGAVTSKQYVLTIGAGNGQLTISPASLPGGSVGTVYAQTLTATGGTGPYTFQQLSSSNSAPGLTITPAGVVTGTPATPGTFSLNVQATDSKGASGTQSYTIVIAAASLAITTQSLADGSIGVAYSQTITAIGGSTPYAFAVTSGALPAGLTLASNGAISGTPTAAGPFAFTVQVTDSSGKTATKAFTINVAAALTIVTTSLPNGSVGKTYTAQIEVAGGTGPYAFGASGNLPDGVTLDPASGKLTGVPSKPGTFSFTATVTDARQHTASQKYTIVIASSVLVTTTSLPNGVAGTPYSATLTASGGTPGYTFVVSGLPAGLSANSAGAITGTPTVTGTFAVGVTVTDSQQGSSTVQIPLTLTLPQLPPVAITGPQDTAAPNQQAKLTVTIATPFPVDVKGTVTLTFVSAVGGDDQMVRFSSTGTRTATFTIPAGSTVAIFDKGDTAVITGTVAGTITLTTTFTTTTGTDVTPSPVPTRVIQIAKLPPVVTAVVVNRNATGFEVLITGFSTTREITQGQFHFTGTNLQASDFTLQLAPAFTTWYQSAASNAFGSQFTLSLPFTVTGNSSSITGVTVTLTNSQGTSQPGSATF